MIRFTRIELSNFVCFENLVIEPSQDPERPLTVIRAENGSGKTTFLRAVRWGMYGERGLPGDRTGFGVHPTFWAPTDAGIETRVVIEFTSDGSTRHDIAPGTTNTRYRLVRTVRTIAHDNDPDYRRINENAQLMFQSLGGAWEPHSYGIDLVIGQLLPWELRDFFVMDADEASEFVGGSEAMTISRSEVEKKTTYAISALLGINVFKKAASRVATAERSFGAKATKAVGDADLNEMQRRRDETRLQIEELEKKKREDERALVNLQDGLARARERLGEELKGIGALEELEKRLAQNRLELNRANKDHEQALAALGAMLEAPSLLAKLARSQMAATVDWLKPMYDSGQIPQRHVGFVQGLLESGLCICGEDLSHPGSHRSHVKEQLAASEADAEHANYLGHVFEAARDLMQLADTSDWSADVEAAEVRLAGAEHWLSELNTDRADIDEKLEAADHSEVTLIQEEIGALEAQIIRLSAETAEHSNRLPGLRSEADALNKKIHVRQNNEIAAVGHRRAEDLAGVIYGVLTRAYETIENDQVDELSSEMNRLFATMVDNVTGDDTQDIRTGKETIRTIAEVGVRPVSSGGFEIFAINNHGRDKPHIEINGASRRVIALAFVLALCSESQTRAPLIADSLLNMMSGAVRRNTLATTARKSGQPILLLTGADLEAESEVETVAHNAGATYTLTAQWHREVMNLTDSRAISLVCECGPRQYCDVCEREGQANRPGWSKRK